MNTDPHQRALDLQRNANNAQLAAGDPDLAYPWLEPHEYPDPGVWIAEAEELLRQHLLDHRDVLGDHPDWQQRYAEIDTPPEPTPLESRWTPDQLFIGTWPDDPPF
ncbi:hypothetical protein IU421_30310 [Nocardia cyriacigeorgica]|uniref:hypothetical protein n=1 Tax=Nocardia cyriacigeorgica TaxID=135487 RepID=UPI001892FB92|nr:hypothetical protein [Nocardia cyriacigeorgica]MBF6518541.1 hypothetical protein [Nocardia cyriacigeorgica]